MKIRICDDKIKLTGNYLGNWMMKLFYCKDGKIKNQLGALLNMLVQCTGGNLISLAGIWSWTKELDKLTFWPDDCTKRKS